MLTTQEKVLFLRDIHTFDALTSEQIEVLADLSETQVFPSGGLIFQQGDFDNSVYIVVDGRVALKREMNAETDSILLTIIKPHQHFGEMSLFSHTPRSFTATAIEDTVLLQILRDVFSAFIRQCPDLLVEVNRSLNQRLEEAYDQLSEIVHSREPRELNTLFEF